MGSLRETTGNASAIKKMRTIAADVLEDLRPGRFGVAGEVHEGTVMSVEEIRDTVFLPVYSMDKQRISSAMVLSKLDEVARVVMVTGWHGSYSLTWEEGDSTPSARLTFNRREKNKMAG